MLVDLGSKASLTCYQTGTIPSCKKGFAYSLSGSCPCVMIRGPGTRDKYCILDGSGSSKEQIFLLIWRRRAQMS